MNTHTATTDRTITEVFAYQAKLDLVRVLLEAGEVDEASALLDEIEAENAAREEGESLPVSGVRHDDAHSLRTDRKLLPMEKAPRRFWCICGAGFGVTYDSTARKAYRAHRA